MPLKSRFCGRGVVVWFHGMPLVDRVAERIGFDERFLVLPVVVKRTAQQNANAEIDVHEIVGDQLAVHDDARRDEHGASPVGHVLVAVIADIRIVERAPAAQQNAALSNFFITRQRLIPEVEEIVVQRHAFLHELHVLHQADEVVGKQLHGGHGADAAGIQGGRMNVASFHQAEHLARQAADHQRLAVEFAGEWIQRRHDIGDGAVSVLVGIGRLLLLRLLPQAGIGLLHHLLAEVHADQVVLKDVVVEHVLGGFAEIDDPLGRAPEA